MYYLHNILCTYIFKLEQATTLFLANQSTRRGESENEKETEPDSETFAQTSLQTLQTEVQNSTRNSNISLSCIVVDWQGKKKMHPCTM